MNEEIDFIIDAAKEQMQHAVEQHGSVAVGKDEPVPVGPGGIPRIVL